MIKRVLAQLVRLTTRFHWIQFVIRVPGAYETAYAHRALKGTSMQQSSNSSLKLYLARSIEVLSLAASSIEDTVMESAVSYCGAALRANLPILVCGNGGSASDAMHITGELVGRFLKERHAINAICLSANAAVLTAWANDYSYDDVFARQVEAHGRPGGILIGLSTSGNSANVVNAALKAKERGMTVISFTGRGGGRLRPVSDVLFAAPSGSTPLIQQVHICVYHHLCERIEAELTA